MQQMHSQHVEMSKMNWRAFDLNLLVVFDGLMHERSVTRAGKRLGMSQPALSHALNRLRSLMEDQLFIRTPKGMVPTPRAEQLAEPLRRALAAMEHALEPETFVPAKATRRFPIAVSNYAAIVIGPPLVAAVATAAPAVALALRPRSSCAICPSAHPLSAHRWRGLAAGGRAGASVAARGHHECLHMSLGRLG